VRSHGTLTRRPEFPDFSRRGNPEHRILAFGKWGTYKRLELMISAFELLQSRRPEARLVIAGGDHPNAHGYVESVKRNCAGNPNIEFTGYVREEQLPDLFQSSSVATMPYSSSTGSSGVAHLACSYGVPIICADLPDFRQMAEGEELAIEFYQPGNAEDLADCLFRFLESPEKQKEMATQNFASALRMTMPNIVQKYLRHFELEQRAEVLRQVTRFRRLPDWVPSKSLMLRLITRNSMGWVHRSALPRPSATRRNGNGNGTPLLNGDGNGSRHLPGSGAPVNGDGVPATGKRRTLRRQKASPAGNAKQADPAQQANQEQALHGASPLHIAYQGEAGYSEGKDGTGVQGVPLPVMKVQARDGSRGNGKS
jgi:hypothetical protein